MAAVRAEAVALEPVGLNHEAVFGGHFLLEAFDFAILELHDLSTARTDQVIMVSLVRDVVVLGLRSEVACLRDARFAEQVQRAIDRRQSEVRILFCQLVIHRFSGDVLLAQKSRQNQLALAGQLQLMLCQMLAKGIQFFGGFAHNGPGKVRAPLKTKEPQPVKGQVGREGCGADYLAWSSSLFVTVE